jgi:catechol 1,2-dioxygenase
MNGLKTVLVYLAGIAALIVITIYFTTGIEPVEAEPPVIKTATALAAAPTATLPTAPANCRASPTSATFGYIPNTPLTTTLAPADLKGERMVISGTVYASDCVTPLAGVLIEVWHADADGAYDREAPYILRGRFRTDANGHYEFSSIKPGGYRTGDTPRPAHVHYRLSYQEEQIFGTRLLFAGDPDLTNPSPIQRAQMIKLTAKEGLDGPILQGRFDIWLPVGPPGPPTPPTPDRQLFLPQEREFVQKKAGA